MIVTATQLEVNGLRGWLHFFAHIGAIRRQLAAAPGVRFVRIRGRRTLTGWDDRAAMLAFRNSGAHLAAMRDLARIGKAKSVTWEAAHEPGWPEAKRRLNEAPFA